MKKYALYIRICLILSAVSLIFFHSNTAYAATKKPLCRPDICVTKSSVPTKYRKLIPTRSEPITKGGTLKTITVPQAPSAGNSTPSPLSHKFKADRTLVQVCRAFVGSSEMQCIDIVKYGACPKTVQLRDPASTVTYSCALECDPPTPNSEGECDCDVRHDQCETL